MNASIRLRDRLAFAVDPYDWQLPIGVSLGRVSGSVRIGVLCFYVTIRCAAHRLIEWMRRSR